MLVANASDLRFNPRGMSRQNFMGTPKMRNDTPRARRWAASDRP